jgi:phosphoribosylamine--glycine ligase
MKILLIGSGGREHALAWKIKQSPLCEKLYCAPGNPGIAEYAECVDINADDVTALTKYAKENKIDFVVVGPETPLVLGIVDLLQDEGIPAFGPSRAAAQLEGSKAFMKDICAKYGIPTAAFGTFDNADEAAIFIKQIGAPCVVKADGLAAGKGVIIAQSRDEANAAVQDMLSGKSFGNAGRKVVIEQFLEGEEVSFFVLSDGKNAVPLTSAQDHKRVGEGDTGPNTGGMGAYAPANPRIMNDAMTQRVMDDIIKPTVAAMEKEGTPFRGVLFAGLMIHNGVPRLLEFNTRFGDPECQAIMMLMEGDIVPVLQACANGTLDRVADSIGWKNAVALCVVMAAQGYPDTYRKGTVIKHLDLAGKVEGVKVFHAGTAKDDKGHIVAKGGRVLGVTSLAPTTAEAQGRAYEAIDKIDWPEGFCRRDIGWRAVG